MIYEPNNETPLKPDYKKLLIGDNAHYKGVYRICRNFLRTRGLNADSIDELTQQAVVKVMTGIDTYNPNLGSFPVWTRKIDSNLLNSEIKKKIEKRNAQNRYLSRTVYSSQTGDEAYDLERKELIERAMSLLEDLELTELRLHSMNGINYEQIGRIREIPIGTVKSRIYKQRKRARKNLEYLFLLQ